MKTRVWIKSGIEEEFDQRQERLLEHILKTIKHYYTHLHGTRPCYKYPLSLNLLAKLSNRSGSAVIQAVRILANTISKAQESRPKITYYRRTSCVQKLRRAYSITLTQKSNEKQ